MTEIAQSFQWVVATMKADSALTTAATGGIWQGFADIGTTSPYALVTLQSGADVLTMNVRRLFDHLTLQIKAVGPAINYTTLITIADRIDALFARVGPTGLSVGGVLACYREQPYTYDELVNGQLWSHIGGLYHIELQGS